MFALKVLWCLHLTQADFNLDVFDYLMMDEFLIAIQNTCFDRTLIVCTLRYLAFNLMDLNVFLNLMMGMMDEVLIAIKNTCFDRNCYLIN